MKTMKSYHSILDWIDTQQSAMVDLVVKWSQINTHTANLSGLEELSKELAKSFSVFNEPVEFIPLPDYPMMDQMGIKQNFPVAPVLSIRKRPKVKKQILLVCHMDTVYPPDDTFREVKVFGDNKIDGPGVADAKGGMVVMLKALEAIEQSPLAKRLGWQVVINTDEEIGSPSSGRMLQDLARNFDLGFVFEPCLSDGNLVGARKGSGNFTMMAYGKSAHAGRDHAMGRNAVVALSKAVIQISGLSHMKEGLTVNVGTVHGGKALNIVPDFAMARYNVRVSYEDDQKYFERETARIVHNVTEETGVKIILEGGWTAPPKLLNETACRFLQHVFNCGRELGLSLGWRDSGGVCDGNRLAAAGLPTVDTMGVQGGAIHSPSEYLMIHSLPERARLTALAILKWTADEWNL